MSANAKVKVIKKSEVNKSQEKAVIETKSKREAAREMVSNVTTWVNEFKERRRENTKQAFENLFSQQTQTNGV